jgi:uncharacterized protein (TIGR03435 family)
MLHKVTAVGHSWKLVTAALIVCLAMSCQTQISQAQGRPISFDVASVRQNIAGEGAGGSDTPHVNFPIGSDDAFYDTGGVFSATNLPLVSFLIFAYKINTNNRQALLDSLPEWAKTEHYNIEARTDLKGVTKDQLRSMMGSLLVERFGLAIHEEERVVPVFTAVLERPNALGPQLRIHPSDANCPPDAPNPSVTSRQVISISVDAKGFPSVCGRFANSMKSSTAHHRRIGGGRLNMAKIVNSFSGVGVLGKPVIDRTGLTGEYDFVVDFLPDPGPEAPIDIDVEGPNFVEAVRKQLGIKLVSDKAPVAFVFVDHVNRPSPN